MRQKYVLQDDPNAMLKWQGQGRRNGIKVGYDQ